MTACLQAGAASSLAALVVFLVVHQLWIRPIWFVAPAGIPIALAGGLAMGWSYFHLRPTLPQPPWTAAGVFGIIVLVLAPAIALRFVLELLVTSMLMGALVGGWLGRTPEAALATALAGLAYAFGPGHNVPMFGTNPAAFKGHAILLIVSAIAAIALPVLAARFDPPPR